MANIVLHDLRVPSELMSFGRKSMDTLFMFPVQRFTSGDDSKKVKESKKEQNMDVLRKETTVAMDKQSR